MTTDKAMTGGNAKKGDFILSSDPNRAMQEMMQAIDALRAVYVEENAALGRADGRAFMAVQEKKILVARQYQRGAAQILERKEDIAKKLDPRLRHALQKKEQEFAVVSRQNLENLDRMRRGTQRLSERIVQATRDMVRKDTHCYGARGHLEPNERAVSVRLNESA